MPKKIRGSIAFALACAASPCCTPIIIPALVLALAGTPFAFWINQNLGIVYGALTLISIISFVLAYRWLRPPSNHQPKIVKLADIPVLSPSKGDQ